MRCERSHTHHPRVEELRGYDPSAVEHVPARAGGEAPLLVPRTQQLLLVARAPRELAAGTRRVGGYVAEVGRRERAHY